MNGGRAPSVPGGEQKRSALLGSTNAPGEVSNVHNLADTPSTISSINSSHANHHSDIEREGDIEPSVGSVPQEGFDAEETNPQVAGFLGSKSRGERGRNVHVQIQNEFLVQSSTLHSSLGASVPENNNDRSRIRKWCKWMTVVVGLVLTFISVLVPVILEPGRNPTPAASPAPSVDPAPSVSSNQTQTVDPSQSPAEAPSISTPAPNIDTATKLPSTVPSSSATSEPQSLESAWIALVLSELPYATFEDGSPQRLALDWMLSDTYTLALSSTVRLLQRFALATLWYATGGPVSWDHRGSWLTAESECQWDDRNDEGIAPSCNSAQSRVQSIYLYVDGLSGSIPLEIGLLTGLTLLELSNSALTSSIPSELGLLTALKWLSFTSNNLSGTIPTEIGRLTALTRFSLSRNNISGSIPTEVLNLSNLKELYFHDNQLVGPIPTTIGSMTDLTVMRLYNNSLVGSIPTEIGLLKLLSILELDQNELSGTVPTQFSDLGNLERLFLHTNIDLSGSIPSSLCGKLTAAWINCDQIMCTCCQEYGGRSCSS